MPEDVARHFAFPNFTTPVSVTRGKVFDNETTTRNTITLNELGMTKGKSGRVSMMLKTVM